MENVTNTMTVSEIRGFTARLMVKADDVRRQKDLVSRLYREAHGEDARDLESVACMLDNELCQTNESIRKLKVIYSRRAAQLALSVV